MRALFKSFSCVLAVFITSLASAQGLKLNDRGFFESGGVEVRIYDNPGGLRIYQKDKLLVTSGGVVVNGDASSVVSRNPDIAGDKLEVKLSTDGFQSYFKARPAELGLLLSVHLVKPLPAECSGTSFLELSLPSAPYLGKAFWVDGEPRVLSGDMLSGNSFVLAPGDDALRIAFRSDRGIIMSLDRDVIKLKSAIPVNMVGDVLQWYVEPSYDSKWSKEAVLGYSHIGYVNGQEKKAAILLNSGENLAEDLRVLRINEDGYRQQVLQIPAVTWGRGDGRSVYLSSDFSALKESGIYCLEYGNVLSDAFIVAEDVFTGKWRGALKRLPGALENGQYDVVHAVLSLVDLWEQFRPEDDFGGNGVPDVIDMVDYCAGRLLGDGDSSDNLTPDGKYERVAAFAAAGRVLRGFDDVMAAKLLEQASFLWNKFGGYSSGNRMHAAVQMWYSTGDELFKKNFYPSVTKSLKNTEGFAEALSLYSMLDAGTKKKMDKFKSQYSEELEAEASATVYGIPNLEGDELVDWALNYYLMWKTFPDSVEPSVVLNCLSAVFGEHSYADDALLDSISPASLPDLIALSIAAERIGAVLAE